jgi:hypothetical protein
MTAHVSNGDRVRAHTSEEVNRRIDEEIRKQVEFYATEPKTAISRRIEELEREWDIERVLQSNASTLALTGAVLGFAVHKRWLYLTFGVLGFLLLHGVQGWCPPVPILRRLGVRTAGEIDKERFALKFLRGDFAQVEAGSGPRSPEAILQAVEA